MARGFILFGLAGFGLLIWGIFHFGEDPEHASDPAWTKSIPFESGMVIFLAVLWMTLTSIPRIWQGLSFLLSKKPKVSWIVAMCGVDAGFWAIMIFFALQEHWPWIAGAGFVALLLFNLVAAIRIYQHREFVEMGMSHGGNNG